MPVPKSSFMEKQPPAEALARGTLLQSSIRPGIFSVRRRFAIALVVLAAVVCPEVDAQMRSGVSVRPAARGRPAQPVRSVAAVPRPGMITPSRAVVSANGLGHSGVVIVNPRFRHQHHFFFSSGCFGPFFNPFLCQQTFFAPPVIWPSPIFWPDTPQTYPAEQPSAAVQYQSDPELRADIDRLTQEVEMLRQEQQAQRQPKVINVPETQPSTVLVFRDGHRVEVQNYGIVGQTFWIFSEQHARKVPLTDLDLQTTEQVNASRGVYFVAPALPEQPPKIR